MLGNLNLPTKLVISGERTDEGYVVTYSNGAQTLSKKYPSACIPKLQLAKDLGAALEHLQRGVRSA